MEGCQGRAAREGLQGRAAWEGLQGKGCKGRAAIGGLPRKGCYGRAARNWLPKKGLGLDRFQMLYKFDEYNSNIDMYVMAMHQLMELSTKTITSMI